MIGWWLEGFPLVQFSWCDSRLLGPCSLRYVSCSVLLLLLLLQGLGGACSYPVADGTGRLTDRQPDSQFARSFRFSSHLVSVSSLTSPSVPSRSAETDCEWIWTLTGGCPCSPGSLTSFDHWRTDGEKAIEVSVKPWEADRRSSSQHPYFHTLSTW